MPTDSSSSGGDDRATETPDDELTFAVHDLGRERAPEPERRDLGFIPARPVVAPPAPGVSIPAAPPAFSAAPAPPADGFVIRDADGVAPIAPVDALVIGAPEPIAAAEPDPARAGPRDRFNINASDDSVGSPGPAELWTTRNPTPAPAAPASEATAAPPRRGWSTRHSEVVDRSAQATMLRLREEAVNVSWQSAWIAVTSCDPRLLRRRSGRAA